MEIRKAEAFIALAEELHFRRAAERLHMAQPPLSRIIRQLEAELDVALFVRSTHHVELTHEGAALLEPAREMVAISRRMRDIAQQAKQGEFGRVRLGFAGASVTGVVSDLVRRMAERRPGVLIDLQSAQLSRPGLDRILDDSLDAVVGRWDSLPREVDSFVLAREHLLLAVPEEHRLAAAARIRPQDVRDERWIAMPGGAGATLSSRLYGLAEEGRFTPRVVQDAADSATQLLLVGVGDGIALTFSGVRDTYPAPGVVFVPFDDGYGDVDVRLAWRRDAGNPALRALIAEAEAESVS